MKVLELKVCSYTRQNHKGLLLHNLIQYSKCCVLLDVTEFKLLNSDAAAFSYPCEMQTLQAGCNF